ncbi:hypothetical protein MBLNU230_g6766t2 [Neophaeotheca triangularis]
MGEIMDANQARFNNTNSLAGDITAQFKAGSDHAIVPLHIATRFGPSGIAELKDRLQDISGCVFSMAADCVSNTLMIQPTGPALMSSPESVGNADSPASEAASPQQAVQTISTKKAKAKVPRPPNAFIIYRKEWHPKILAQMPHLHNNQISVIIGQQWRKEADSVKEIYKRKSESAKSQHALDHPDYQYQPRKPSEKKKRMTKRKLAALNATQQPSNAPAPPSEGFTVDNFVEPYLPQNYGVMSEGANYNTFDAGEDARSGLMTSVAELNEQRAGNVNTDAIVASTGVDLVNGQQEYERMTFDFQAMDSNDFEIMLRQTLQDELEKTDDHNGPTAMAEVYRQNQLEAELGAFGYDVFDFEGASAGPSTTKQQAQDIMYDGGVGQQDNGVPEFVAGVSD